MGGMKVCSWMIPNVVTIGPDAGIREALEVMKKYSIRHLPVVDNDEFVGLVTLGDLKQAILASMLEQLKVNDVMIREPYTTSPDTTLESAAMVIYEKNIGCLPVLDGKELVGIITVNDILKAFIDIMGVLKAGSRIDVVLKRIPGSFDEVISIIEAKGGFVISVGMSINGENPIHHFRVSGGNIAAIAQELRDLGYRKVEFIE
ncbi:MAG: signal transduction protein [Deltaproteobacteria bacterium]|nr:MAG: signal transduction protein [Deltaproteobacteria bacterium]